MAKEIDKIIQSKTAPKSNNVLWDDGENLKINRNGKWESTGSGLNIDPELMEYLINPIVLKDGDRIPEALYDKENDFVKGWKEWTMYPYIKALNSHGGCFQCDNVWCCYERRSDKRALMIDCVNLDFMNDYTILNIKNGICHISLINSI